MPLISFEGLKPRIHPSAFVAPTATLVGDVIVEEHASIWYGVVIRADYAPVIVRRRANVQDNAVIHGPPGLTTDVGVDVTVAHCVVHGRPARTGCIVANGSVVLDERRSGQGTRGRRLGRGRRDVGAQMICGLTGVVRRPVKGSGAETWVDTNPAAYVELGQRHRRGIAFVDPEEPD